MFSDKFSENLKLSNLYQTLGKSVIVRNELSLQYLVVLEVILIGVAHVDRQCIIKSL